MKQVLVVDDEPVIRDVIQDILHDEGFDVLVATGGRGMLELLKSERPAMILLDIMMPDGDGRGAFEQMRSMPHICHIPVVMMSAGVIGTSRSPLTLRFLAKPFDLDHLLEVVIGTIGTAAE